MGHKECVEELLKDNRYPKLAEFQVRDIDTKLTTAQYVIVQRVFVGLGLGFVQTIFACGGLLQLL